MQKIYSKSLETEPGVEPVSLDSSFIFSTKVFFFFFICSCPFKTLNDATSLRECSLKWGHSFYLLPFSIQSFLGQKT